MKKTLLLFDVDGTIAESGCEMNINIKNVLYILKDTYDLGVVGGGTFEKIKIQLGTNTLFKHIFSECGCVYNKIHEGSYKTVYKKNIRLHEEYSNINKLIKICLSYLSKVNYEISGHFIDLRHGIVYVSLIGMCATEEERASFIDYDGKHGVRTDLINILNASLNGNKRIKILKGGNVGIGIYPNEYDKSQVLHSLKEYDNICFFGDKYSKDGNDYELITHDSVTGYPVNSVYDTLKILKKFCNDKL